MLTNSITTITPSTARLVEQTRRELLAAFSDPVTIPHKVLAYTEAVRRHREVIFADVLRDVRSLGTVC